jgi:GTPase SAR1 family protein
MDYFIGEESTEDLQTRKAMVFGAVGSGKTSMAHYVSGLYTIADGTSKMSGHSITKGVQTYKGKYIELKPGIKVQYTMCDSEGYGSDEFSRDALRNQIINAMRFETELNAVILVASFERFRNGLKDDFAHIIGVIKTLGIADDNIILCLTHCEMYTDGVKAAYFEEFKKYYGVTIKDTSVVFGCFANIGEINDSYKPLFAEGVKTSIAAIRGKLHAMTTPINIAMKIRDVEKTA